MFLSTFPVEWAGIIQLSDFACHFQRPKRKFSLAGSDTNDDEWLQKRKEKEKKNTDLYHIRRARLKKNKY